MILPVSIAAILLVAVAGFNLLDSNAQAQPITLLECVGFSHFDKIIFENEDDLLNRDGNLAAEEGSIMDIKVLDDPNRIEFPMQKAVDRLNAVGWTTEDGEPITLEDLELIDVEYAIVCATALNG